METRLTVSYYQSGPIEAPPLILSSSLGTTAEMWHPQLQDLASRFRVISYDHRGHGASPVPPGPYSLEDLSIDVLDMMDELSISNAHFAGLSLGGMVGMWLGANAAERVGRLALLCTFADVASPEIWKERASVVRESGTETMVDASIDRWFTPGFQQTDPDVVTRYREILTSVPNEGYAGCCEAIETLDIASRLGDIESRTLVIAGTHDSGATPAVGRRLAEAISHGRYEEVDAAHLASVEKPGEVTSLLLEHFS